MIENGKIKVVTGSMHDEKIQWFENDEMVSAMEMKKRLDQAAGLNRSLLFKDITGDEEDDLSLIRELCWLVARNCYKYAQAHKKPVKIGRYAGYGGNWSEIQDLINAELAKNQRTQTDTDNARKANKYDRLVDLLRNHKFEKVSDSIEYIINVETDDQTDEILKGSKQ